MKQTVVVCVLGSIAAIACSARVDSDPGKPTLGRAQQSLSCSKKRDRNALFVPPPNSAALEQIEDLIGGGKTQEASLISEMIAMPQAVWFTGGSPKTVKKSVRKTTTAASRAKRTPVLVAYNLPFRDCAQYSEGGALNTAAYEAWIDGFAKGIGKRRAIVVLEPDGLGIIPYNTTFWGAAEWCQPTIETEDGSVVPAPGASPENRYAELRYALSSLAQHAPNARVYLDATHSHWLGVGEAAYRLYLAGFEGPVPQFTGFFLNASNYHATTHATQFGTWVSMCLATAMASPVDPGYLREDGVPQLGWCQGQYNAALDYAVDYSDGYATETTAQIQGLMDWIVPGTKPTISFVIDTSRNGQGAFDPAPYGSAPYHQPESVLASLNAGSWCNPPGRGLGLRPTLNTGHDLIDAYLWIKIPGESDGSCDSAGGARAWDFGAYNPWGVPESEQPRFDPLWGMVSPAAGAWFAEQALELAANANPPLF